MIIIFTYAVDRGSILWVNLLEYVPFELFLNSSLLFLDSNRFLVRLSTSLDSVLILWLYLVNNMQYKASLAYYKNFNFNNILIYRRIISNFIIYSFKKFNISLKYNWNIIHDN